MTSQDEISGGCLCGSVRFMVTGTVAAAAYCHCADCGKCTGSAFNISVPVNVASFKLLSGTPKGFAKTADSGNALTRHFCVDCGSPLFTSSPYHPDRVYVKAGALDDPSVVVPAYQSWVSSSVAWSSIPRGLPGYAKARSQSP
jgi:hypothetical protein